MTIPHLPQQRFPNDTRSFLVPSEDRFARRNAARRRDMALMRRIEVNSLGRDFSIQDSVHVVPQTETFERAVCGIARGTLIATPQGPLAIEDMLPGDMVNSSEGPQRVLWIGSTTIVPGQTGGSGVLNGLIRVTADALGRGRPAGDLVLGPGAAVLHNPPQFRAANGKGHVLTPLADFIDGLSVFRVTPPSAVKVYHLMLARHAVVEAGGLEIESYHPGIGAVAKMGASAQALFMSLFPTVAEPRDFGPLAYPRVEMEMLDGLRAGG